MPKVTYIDKNFSTGSLATIATAVEIIEEYQAEGYSLTLRQLYYQFVARGLIANKQTEYKRLGSIINDGRLAGLIDWSAIEDRTRYLNANPHWSSPNEIVRTCAAQFAYDKWDTQPCRIEVWIEKDALTGVIAPACDELDIPYFACRGYSSQSAQWRAGERFRRNNRAYGQETVILHFGDHDPSGVDMTRDNSDRLTMFSYGNSRVIRIALNMDQIEEYSPPPNPAKLTDSRAGGYISEYGYDSWELDALEPRVIDRLIRDEVAKYVDNDAWNDAEAREDEAKDALDKIASDWDAVMEFLNDG